MIYLASGAGRQCSGVARGTLCSGAKNILAHLQQKLQFKVKIGVKVRKKQKKNIYCSYIIFKEQRENLGVKHTLV